MSVRLSVPPTLPPPPPHSGVVRYNKLNYNHFCCYVQYNIYLSLDNTHFKGNPKVNLRLL